MSSRASRRYGLSRRDVIKTAVGAAAAAGPFFHVAPARAAKTLKILQWSHFVPGYDKWFNNTYTKEWGAKNGTEVIVDNINVTLIPSRAAAEASAQKGHDLVMFLSPPSVYEDQVSDMSDVYAACSPLILPITLVALLFGIIFTFTDLIVVFVLTRGGPYDKTQVIASWAFFTGIQGGDLAGGAAISLFLFPVLAGVAILFLWLARHAEVT
jgi:hypothetical protein